MPSGDGAVHPPVYGENDFLNPPYSKAYALSANEVIHAHRPIVSPSLHWFAEG